MASIYKTIRSEDIASTRTVLHEAIPITGTIVSGTYGTYGSENNVKNYAHGMFQSVYDYPYLSSSANHIFDITLGVSTGSVLSSSVTSQQSKKVNIYNQMAQVLMGYDKNGVVQRFDEDGNLFSTTTDKINDCLFLNFSRLLVKDELQKGTFTLELGVSGTFTTPFGDNRISLKDVGAASDYRVNSPAGEYAILYVSNSHGTPLSGISFDPNFSGTGKEQAAGLLFYQAGVAVISSSVFLGTAQGGLLSSSVEWEGNLQNITASITGSNIETNSNSLRHRMYDLSFNNSVELNSTIYFCHLGANEFNYSSNPTYLSGSQIVVKAQSTDDPVSYLTTIGLYSSDNQLMATAKVSEPIKKTPSTSLTFRVRLDY
tara:strand:+ start:11732 stop:12847 length:1116 start_codon:yes stop_codon:yes gene_type:complete